MVEAGILAELFFVIVEGGPRIRASGPTVSWENGNIKWSLFKLNPIGYIM